MTDNTEEVLEALREAEKMQRMFNELREEVLFLPKTEFGAPGAHATFAREMTDKTEERLKELREAEKMQRMFNELREEVLLLAKTEQRFDPPRRAFDEDTLASLSRIERRMLVRAIFSAIDAVVHHMKQDARDGDAELSPGELALIDDQSFRLNDRGEPVPQVVFPNALPNMRFAFRVYAKAFCPQFSPEYGGYGWKCMTQAVKVRNSITHPRTLDDLTVTTDQICECMAAFAWFDKTLTQMKAATEAHEEERMKGATRYTREELARLFGGVEENEADAGDASDSEDAAEMA